METFADRIRVFWQVEETQATYRREVMVDGGPCWQDSCVELFISAVNAPSMYINFEFNSLGFCLAARGPDRVQRTELTPDEYATILRKPEVDNRNQNGKICWSLAVEIPKHLLGATQDQDLRKMDLCGNVYKCGDKTQEPHWLMAFPINTPKPDFHRPEFFQSLA